MTREEAKRTFEDLRGYKIILSDLPANEQQELWDAAISALSENVRPNIHATWEKVSADNPSAFEGMTNGEVLISLYPNLKYTIQNGRVVTTIGVASSFDLDWWNAPYQKGGM